MILFFVFTTTFAFEFAAIEAAWKDRGYKITIKSNYEIVEFKFNYENIATLDLGGKELIVYTLVGSELKSPTEKYILDIENIFKNSGVDVELIVPLLGALSDKDYNFGKEIVVGENYLLKTTVYQKNSILLQFKFAIDAINISQKIDVEENKLLKERVEKLQTESSNLKTENIRLKTETESKSRKIESLEAKSNGLEDTLDKYQNLSDYKETITENLQRTIERYKEIERQKLDEIRLKTSIIDDLNDKITEMAFDSEQREFKLTNQIEGLKNDIKSLEEEKRLLKESENHYESRLYMINSLYNLAITESEMSISVPETVVETKVITAEQPAKEKNTTDKNTASDTSIALTNTDETKPVEMELGKKLTEEAKENEKVKTHTAEKRLKVIKGYNNDKITHQVEYEYDKDGKLLKETVTLPSGQIVNVVESKYYENGKLYEKSTYQNSKFVGKGFYQYNKEGQPERIFIYDTDSITGYQVFEYDNNLSEETPITIKIYEDNQLKMVEINTLDKKGNILRTEQRDADNQLLSFRTFEIENTLPVSSIYYQGTEKKYHTINKFDEAGHITSQKTFDTEDKLLSSLVFVYE